MQPPHPPPHGGFVPPPAGTYAPAFPPAPPQPTTEAMTALICGLIAPSCFITGFVALYFGVKARRMVREDPQRNGGDQLALIGMIIGGLFAIGTSLFLLAYVGMIAAMFFGMWASSP